MITLYCTILVVLIGVSAWDTHHTKVTVQQSCVHHVVTGSVDINTEAA